MNLCERWNNQRKRLRRLGIEAFFVGNPRNLRTFVYDISIDAKA